MKRVLYIKSPNPAWLDIASHMQKHHHLQPVLWISGTETYHDACKDLFPETEIFDHHEIMRAHLPEKIPPADQCVDGRFLSANAVHEDIFYNMMDRWCGNPEKISMEKRRSFYIDMVNACFAIYEHFSIDIVIMPTVPHRLYDYIAWVVAKDMGIPFIMLCESNDVKIDAEGNKKTLFYFIDDVFDQSKQIRQACKEFTGVKRLPGPEIQRYIDSFFASYDDLIPSYFKKKGEQEKTLSLIKKIKRTLKTHPMFLPPRAILRAELHFLKTGTLHNKKLVFPYRAKARYPVRFQNVMAESWQYQKTKSRTEKAKLWYEQNCTEPDLSEKYLYFAPSYQPERSSTPDARLCQWPELMIEMLADSIPADWKIYYKEHPSNFRKPIMPDNNRSVALYKRLQHIAPNIKFLPVEHDPLKIIDAAQCVATATGTSAWQAVTRGVPAMIFGEIWFRSCPGIFYIRSTEECRTAIQAIQKGAKPDKKEIIKYLCALEFIGGEYGWARGWSPYDPKQANLKAFCENLHKTYAPYFEKNARLPKRSAG